MDQVLKNQWWPRSSTAVSITMNLRWRANEGSGSWQNGSAIPTGGISDLVSNYSAGWADGAPLSVLVESLILFLMNQGIAKWYCPKVGTPEEAIRKALLQLIVPAGAGSIVVGVFFDGQFGSVYVG